METIENIDFGKYHKCKLARWWCDLNTWKWPHDYPLQRPEDWETIPQHINFDRSSRTKFNLIGKEIEKIAKHISRKDMLKYWNGPYKNTVNRTTE